MFLFIAKSVYVLRKFKKGHMFEHLKIWEELEV